MRKLWIIGFLLLTMVIVGNADAATKYAITGGGNWSGATWATASNQAVSDATKPIAGDVAILDQYSGNVTIDEASACTTLTMTGYAGTLAFGTQTLTVSGVATVLGAMTSTSGVLNVGGGVTLGGTPTGTFPALNMTGAGALTCATYTWPGALTFNGVATYTISGAAVVTGLVTFSAVNTLNFTTAEVTDTLTCNGGVTCSAVMLVGTAKIIVGGGTLQSTATTQYFANDMDIVGNVTIGTYLGFKTKTLTYISGTVTTSGSTLLMTSGAYDTDGITWNNINAASGSPVLGGGLTCTGTFNIGSTSSISGAYNISCGTLTLETNAENRSLTFTSGQTFTVTTAMHISSSVNTTMTINSGTATSHFHLVYQGTRANCDSYRAIFTDVDASGSAQGIDNWYGGTITRCTNITNRTSANLCDLVGITG